MPTDSSPLAEPVTAELIDELTEGVAGAPQRLTDGGWAALSGAGELLVLDDHLRVVGRFRVPEQIVPELEYHNRPPRCRLDISPDGRLAVFASIDRIVVVDRNGDVQWQTVHTPPGCVGNEVASCAIFTAEGTHLWAFVPQSGGAADQTNMPGTLPYHVERWVVAVADWQVTARTATAYSCHSEVLVHPDGRHAGFASFDGDDGWSGQWVHSDDAGVETVVYAGPVKTADIHPSGTRWLAHDPCELLVGDCRDASVSRIPIEEDDDEVPEEEWDEDSYGGYDTTFVYARLVTTNLVLAACEERTKDPTQYPHLLFSVDPPRRLGPVSYLRHSAGEQPNPASEVVIASAGDGTWLTFTPTEQNTRIGHLQRWRPYPPIS